MGVGGADNPLWLDVLEWGPDSAHAGWFDIDWDPDRRYLRDKLLVPFLGDQYGAVLEAGQLALRFDDGGRQLRRLGLRHAQAADLPAALRAHPRRRASGAGAARRRLLRPRRMAAAGRRRARELKAELAALCRERADVRDAVAAAVGRLNGAPGRLDSWRDLDALIQDQHWRAAHFRVAADDINYRRFFNINDLAGMRMELPEVFDHAHRLVFRLCWKAASSRACASTTSTGCSIPRAICSGCASRRRERFYLVVEKILAPARSAARGLAGRGHHRLRVRQPRARAAGRSGRRGGLHPHLYRLRRPPPALRGNRCATASSASCATRWRAS